MCGNTNAIFSFTSVRGANRENATPRTEVRSPHEQLNLGGFRKVVTGAHAGPFVNGLWCFSLPWSHSFVTRNRAGEVLYRRFNIVRSSTPRNGVRVAARARRQRQAGLNWFVGYWTASPTKFSIALPDLDGVGVHNLLGSLGQCSLCLARTLVPTTCAFSTAFKASLQRRASAEQFSFRPAASIYDLSALDLWKLITNRSSTFYGMWTTGILMIFRSQLLSDV
ncbi:hypothetical protein BV360_05593 [Pseudomonas syringae pv. actinidiae]|nr:hypothetical protein BV339_05574 [Pseudomonas syringae pv. actinidiae]OSN12223.1 hypothetical protein BV340_05525 [Pseudomonas syringae pv. actinidiae]OSN13338.1 hypothetical protein BV341_05631 [Pseudomonas syringae pv. actinidiae]OSN26919.1 hypothetical protein BV343_05480 [Pseudomonas syringae pv. actinidiae]OSN28285.1 hypothetical protein BV342_05655 [Pseudomonas syringae pv. actinidiae]